MLKATVKRRVKSTFINNYGIGTMNENKFTSLYYYYSIKNIPHSLLRQLFQIRKKSYKIFYKCMFIYIFKSDNLYTQPTQIRDILINNRLHILWIHNIRIFHAHIMQKKLYNKCSLYVGLPMRCSPPPQQNCPEF